MGIRTAARCIVWSATGIATAMARRRRRRVLSRLLEPTSSTLTPTLPSSSLGSSASSTVSSASSTATPQGKRGLVYVPRRGLFPADDLLWNRPWSTIYWYYNYLDTPADVYNSTLEFLPMLFGDFNNTFVDDHRPRARGRRAAHPPRSRLQRARRAFSTRAAARSTRPPARRGGSPTSSLCARTTSPSARPRSRARPAGSSGCRTSTPPATAPAIRTSSPCTSTATSPACSGWSRPSPALYPNMTVWLYLNGRTPTRTLRQHASHLQPDARLARRPALPRALLLLRRLPLLRVQRRVQRLPARLVWQPHRPRRLVPRSAPRRATTSPARCPAPTARRTCAAASPTGSTTRIRRAGDVFTIECYVDHFGGDIAGDGAQTNPSPSASRCARTRRSRATTSAGPTGRATLKSSALASPTTDFNVWGARLLATGARTSTTSPSSAPTSSATTSDGELVQRRLPGAS